MANFVSYNSSAGSGKTFTLVKEYLKIALETEDPSQYRRILAITFTNKAAAEMKERILGALKSLSDIRSIAGTPAFLLSELTLPVEQGGLGIPAEQLESRSRKVLKSILHNYNDFGISTIDKFTHKIVRTFAHDLQLPLNFSVELEEEDVLKASIDLLITEVGNNKKLTKLLVDYAVQKSQDEQSWSVEKDLLNFAKKLLKDDGEIHLENIRKLSVSDFDGIKENLYQQIKSFEQTVKTLGVEGIDYINRVGIAPASFNRGYFYKYWQDLSQFKKLTPNETVLGMINGSKDWYAKSKPESEKQLIDAHKDKLTELFEQSRAYIEEQEGKYVLIKQLLTNLYNLAVVNEIEKTVLEFKNENNILNISDFNKRIAAIVASEPVPFIYERLGEKYQHYLIDEFQDTSIVQWHNLLPLVDNSLANGKFNMVVGDAKQAIYRWRGGEVEQIINFPSVYKHNNNPLLLEREASIDRNFEEKELKQNFRSKAEIVSFNNNFFRFVASELSENYNKLYANLEQGYNADNIGGGVTIDFKGSEKSETYAAIKELIKQSQADGYQLKDIAVLTRGREDGKAIAVELLNENIQVVSAESLLLNHSKKVTFILDLLRYIAFPTDKSYQIRVLTYLTQYVYHEDLYEIAAKPNAVASYLKVKEKQIKVDQLQKYSLYEIIEHLYEVFDFDQEVDIYLQFLLDKGHEYASRNDNSILNFLEWWDLKSANFSIVIPEGIDAVQVMTIHKSKGLEFPVVIYPFANSVVTKSEDFFWTDELEEAGLKSGIMPINKALLQTKFATVFEQEMNKSKLDLINLMYVAFTRPKDRLHILSKKVDKPSENGAIPDYLTKFCSHHNANQTSEHDYEYGSFQPNTIRNDNMGKGLLFGQTSYSNWRNKIAISYQAPKVWDVEQPESIGEQGTLIHNILSKISSLAEVDKVLDTVVHQGVINTTELPIIRNSLENMFKKQEIRSLFEDYEELKAERSILMSSGKSYQPDRVVVKQGKTYLIDYKTGVPKKSHHDQILMYRSLLLEMGYENVITLLLYVKEGNLVTVN